MEEFQVEQAAKQAGRMSNRYMRTIHNTSGIRNTRGMLQANAPGPDTAVASSSSSSSSSKGVYIMDIITSLRLLILLCSHICL